MTDSTARTGVSRADSASPKPIGGMRAWLIRTVPFAAVMAGLAAVGYYGHRTEWTFSFAPLREKADLAAAPTYWVEDGGTNAAGWCREHGVFDCPTCRPELAQLDRPPSASASDRAIIAKALTARIRPVGDPSSIRLPRRIRFVSAEAVEKAGIDIALAWQSGMTEAVAASGEISFDPARVARVSTRAAGTAWRVGKTVGDPVAIGEVLAIVDAAEVGKAKTDLLQALVQVRLKTQAVDNLAAAGAVSEQKRREADAALKNAEVRLLEVEQTLANFGLPVRVAEFEKRTLDAVADQLQRLGLPDDLVKATAQEALPGTLLPLRSPIAGVVVRADLIAGEMIDPTRPAFVVVDARRVWVALHIPPGEVRWLALGLPVRFRPDGCPVEAAGTLSWIGSTADETSRTVPVRAELANEEGRLRASGLGLGRVVLREEPNAIVVPNEAVHALAGHSVVFVRDKDFLKADGPKAFHTRTVRTGAKDATNTEIVVGLVAGEVVASKGSEVLWNELRKNETRTNAPHSFEPIGTTR